MPNYIKRWHWPKCVLIRCPSPSRLLLVPLFYLSEAHQGLLSVLIRDNLIRSWKSDKLAPSWVKEKIKVQWEWCTIKVANLQDGNLWKTKKKRFLSLFKNNTSFYTCCFKVSYALAVNNTVAACFSSFFCQCWTVIKMLICWLRISLNRLMELKWVCFLSGHKDSWLVLLESRLLWFTRETIKSSAWKLNSPNFWLLIENNRSCTTSLLVLVTVSCAHCLFSSILACKDAAQSMLCWTAACSQRASLAFLAGEHKCWPQDRTLSPLLWVTALLEMWTQDLVAPIGS